MEKFRELNLKVDSKHSADFAKAVSAALTNGWVRAWEAEQRAEAMDSVSGEAFYFKCDRRDGREAALLAIYRRDGETLYVSNIVPSEKSELSHEQYNTILKDFHDSVLSKLSPTFPIMFLLGSNILRIEDTMKPEVFQLLRHFSASANKSTGSSHPIDRERWYAFLVVLARSPHRLDSLILMRWLIETEHWPERVAQDLVIEFEFAMGLLDAARKSK